MTTSAIGMNLLRHLIGMALGLMISGVIIVLTVRFLYFLQKRYP